MSCGRREGPLLKLLVSPPSPPRPSSPPAGAKRGAKHSAPGRRPIDKARTAAVQTSTERRKPAVVRPAALTAQSGAAGRVRVPGRDNRACALARGSAKRTPSATPNGYLLAVASCHAPQPFLRLRQS